MGLKDLSKNDIGKKVIFEYYGEKYEGLIAFKAPHFYILNNNKVNGAADTTCLSGTNYRFCRSIADGTIKLQKDCQVIILKFLNSNNYELWEK